MNYRITYSKWNKYFEIINLSTKTVVQRHANQDRAKAALATLNNPIAIGYVTQFPMPSSIATKGIK